jgi:hypothetical protein
VSLSELVLDSVLGSLWAPRSEQLSEKMRALRLAAESEPKWELVLDSVLGSSWAPRSE